VLAALVLAAALGVAPRAAAAQNRPTWATGDTWTFQGTEGTTTITMVFTVRERTTLTVGSVAYGAWHMLQTVTATFGTATITVTIDQWIRDEDLGTVRTYSSFVFNTTTTYSPPKPAALFPLAVGSQWSGNVTSTTELDSGPLPPVTEAYSGRVVDERGITTPAGTFQAAAVRSPATGNPYTVSWYSEAVGNAVRVEEYDDSGVLSSSMNLVSFRYQGSLGLLFLIVGGLVLLGVVAAVALLVLRRRRAPPAMAPPPAPVQGPPMPSAPSPPPAQEPPSAPPFDEL
jgi:hypothetical protein